MLWIYGLSVGSSSFVLANFFDRVIGLDFSESFIGAANEIKSHGSLKYEYLEEGRDLRPRNRSMPEEFREGQLRGRRCM